MSVTKISTTKDTAVRNIDKIYFAKINGGLIINTDSYAGEDQFVHFKRVYKVSDGDLENIVCGVISDGLIQFYSGISKHPAVMSELTPREIATILNTHNAFFKHNRFKVYNGIIDCVPIHL